MTTIASAEVITADIDKLDQYLIDRHLHGSWMGRSRAERPFPKPELRTGAEALHWKWVDIYAGLLEAGVKVPVGPKPRGLTEMRSIRGVGAGAKSINMNAQILMPGERTRAHHNIKNETRLVHEAPRGAVFVCDGEAFPMERGDLIISPTWSDHDHFNGGDAPAIWVDGYDSGYARLGAEINVRYPVEAPFQEIRRSGGFSEKTLGRVAHWPNTRNTTAPRPPVRYPWVETAAALDALVNNSVEPDPYEGFHLMFTSPVDGGPTLPSMAWHVQQLPGGMSTKAHRHNSTTCYHVFEGEGETVIDDEHLSWNAGDLFVVPAWSWHHHQSSESSDAVLFSIDDWPAMTKLGYYCKEEAVEQ